MAERRAADLVAVAILLACVGLFAGLVVDFSAVPHEDAAILMRYALHLAQGHGIVWNIGDKPVDGATDFLFLLVVALLTEVGLSLQLATRSVGLASHVLTVLLVYLALRRLFRAPLAPALVSALYLAVGPGLYYVAAYFGTPFFALSAATTWYLALKLVQEPQTHATSSLFAVSALVTGLIRPEGAILSGLMLLSIMSLRGVRGSLLVLRYFLAIFCVAGGAYFAWRWQYFGYPLPNPFYKKGGGHIYPWSLLVSFKNVIVLSWPFLLIFVFAPYSYRGLRTALGFAIPVLGFASSFILLSNETNFAARFQYVILPVVLMSWWPLVKSVREDLATFLASDLTRRKRATLAVVCVLLGVAVTAYSGGMWHSAAAKRGCYRRDGRYDVAIALRDFQGEGFTLATTEAGLLPFYSGWQSIDAWGLNDQTIAHSGGVTAEYLDRFRPHVIVFHAFFSPLVPETGSGKWYEMVKVLMSYAESREYNLTACFGVSPYESHYYYVRRDFPEGAAIAERIRAVDYWLQGERAVNYVPAVAQLSQRTPLSRPLNETPVAQ